MPGFGSWNEQPDDELLASLARIQAVVSQVDAALHDHVAILRDRGISWTRIGQALGVSKQAAWERFSGEDLTVGTATTVLPAVGIYASHLCSGVFEIHGDGERSPTRPGCS